MLWLAVHFHRLPLEVFTRAGEVREPLVIVHGEGGRQRILLCNEAAAASGIRPGMHRGAAQALAAELCIRERNRQAEHNALEGLAAWAGRFTPVVSLAAPDALLLEVGGSLRLFGGAASLQQQVCLGVSRLGYHGLPAIAPTPTGALLLARAGSRPILRDMDALRRHILQLPLESVGLPPPAQDGLREMGLQTVGDCLRLPRAGLARRIGPSLQEAIGRALGRLPDPRARFEAPPRFTSRLVFAQAAEGCEAVMFAAHRQLMELAGFLEGRCGGVQVLRWSLFHRCHQPTRVSLGLLSPSRDITQLTDLLRERLERLHLPGPVEAVGLCAGSIMPLAGCTRELFPGAAVETQRRVLLERLRVRFGPESVQGLQTVAEHRPECAWRRCDPGLGRAGEGAARRPLWLLEQPQPLRVVGGAPQFEGALHLEGEAERVESGWWDGGDLRRDYFVARNPGGGRFWIFRELGGRRGWFVHGIFE